MPVSCSITYRAPEAGKAFQGENVRNTERSSKGGKVRHLRCMHNRHMRQLVAQDNAFVRDDKRDKRYKEYCMIVWEQGEVREGLWIEVRARVSAGLLRV